MIFLTVGSHEPFDRLVQAFDDVCDGAEMPPIVAQVTASCKYVPRNFETVADLAPDAYAETLSQAGIIIAHAGMGTILAALQNTIPIVVMPRRGHFSETRNDHQWGTAKKFKGRAGVFVALDETELKQQVDAAKEASNSPQSAAIAEFADDRLLAFLRGVAQA